MSTTEAAERGRDVRWLPTTVVEPSPRGDSSYEVEISNALLQKRLGAFRRGVSELIAASVRGPSPQTETVAAQLRQSGVLDPAPVDRRTSAGIQRWRARNWTPSLDLFLWSRRWQFDDNGPTFEEQRDEILTQFLEEEGDPPLREASTGTPLPAPAAVHDLTVGEVLSKRASSYRRTNRPLPAAVLASVLSDGLRPIRTPRREPEEGQIDYDALVGLDRVYDFFFAALDVPELEPGIYFYDVRNDRCEMVRAGIYRDELRQIVIGQPAPMTAGAVIFISTEFARINWGYRHERVLRNIYINAGKLMQDLILVATAHGLNTSITPALRDTAALELLGLDAASDQALYSLALC